MRMRIQTQPCARTYMRACAAASVRAGACMSLLLQRQSRQSRQSLLYHFSKPQQFRPLAGFADFAAKGKVSAKCGKVSSRPPQRPLMTHSD